jgi:hypothetical protein
MLTIDNVPVVEISVCIFGNIQFNICSRFRVSCCLYYDVPIPGLLSCSLFYLASTSSTSQSAGSSLSLLCTVKNRWSGLWTIQLRRPKDPRRNYARAGSTSVQISGPRQSPPARLIMTFSRTTTRTEYQPVRWWRNAVLERDVGALEHRACAPIWHDKGQRLHLDAVPHSYTVNTP